MPAHIGKTKRAEALLVDVAPSVLVEENGLPLLQVPASQALRAMAAAWDRHVRDVWVEFFFPEEHVRDREVERVVHLERLVSSAEDDFQIAGYFASARDVFVHDAEFLGEA